MIKLTDNDGDVFILAEDIAIISTTKLLGTIITLKNGKIIACISETPQQVYELREKYYESLP